VIVEKARHPDGPYAWWRLVAPNGKTLATSEMYSTTGAANRAARKAATILGLPVHPVTRAA
jgi:hypothetical protein